MSRAMGYIVHAIAVATNQRVIRAADAAPQQRRRAPPQQPLSAIKSPLAQPANAASPAADTAPQQMRRAPPRQPSLAIPNPLAQSANAASTAADAAPQQTPRAPPQQPSLAILSPLAQLANAASTAGAVCGGNLRANSGHWAPSAQAAYAGGGGAVHTCSSLTQLSERGVDLLA